MAAERGAACLGLVSRMPSGPGVIGDETIAESVAVAPRGVRTFLLTCSTAAQEIAEQAGRLGVTTVQLVDHVAVEERRALRALMPALEIVQVIHVTDPTAVDQALAARDADALLLDSGNPSLAVKELGGTGRVHDWRVSRAIRDASPVPVWLAGGLNADNAAAAIAAVEPFGLDVCSGVRTNGQLDPAKLAAYVDAIASVTDRRPPLLDA